MTVSMTLAVMSYVTEQANQSTQNTVTWLNASVPGRDTHMAVTTNPHDSTKEILNRFPMVRQGFYMLSCLNI
jgi:hypothetical protein